MVSVAGEVSGGAVVSAPEVSVMTVVWTSPVVAEVVVAVVSPEVVSVVGPWVQAAVSIANSTVIERTGRTGCRIRT